MPNRRIGVDGSSRGIRPAIYDTDTDPFVHAEKPCRSAATLLQARRTRAPAPPDWL